MADLARKTGSGFDLLRNPSAFGHLVKGDACVGCCDTPCHCYEFRPGVPDRPLYKAPYNANYPLGADTFRGTCKCMDASFADPAQDTPARTVALAGPGTAHPHYKPNGGGLINCTGSSYACDWSGSFAVACSLIPSNWYKADFLCQVNEEHRDYLLGLGIGVNIYYYKRVLLTHVSGAMVDGSVAHGPLAAISATLYTGWAYNRSVDGILAAGWHPDETSYGFFRNQLGKAASWLWESENEYQMYPWQEATCPPVDCQPFGAIAPCSPIWGLKAGYPKQESPYPFACWPTISSVTAGLS